VGRPLSVGENLAVALGALALAALTYVLVENPVRHLAALRDRPGRGLTAGAAVSVLAAGLCVLITVLVGGTAGTGYRAPALTGVAKLQRNLALAAGMPAVPANLTPALTAAPKDKPRLYADKCSPAFADPEVKTPCAYGDLTSPTTVVLFGDSHAGHWFPALEKIALERRWKLVVVTKSACSAADVVIYEDALKRRFTECVQWRRSAWRHIRSLRPAKVIMASTLPHAPLLDVTGSLDDAWSAAWRRSLDAVKGPGTDVYFVNDTPWQARNVPDCLSAHLDNPAACARSRTDAVQFRKRRALVAGVARAEGATVIDPLPWFCTATTCPVIVGNLLVYKDQHHITTAYSRLLVPLLAEALQP
jgi:hypothetical protein